MSADADPPEGFNYGGKFGWVYQESNTFDDILDTLRYKYLHQKIIKIKIWSGKKEGSDVIYGIQAYYKNLNTGVITKTKEYRGDGFEKVDEFDIPSNEYLKYFKVRIDSEVTHLGFGTNKKREIDIGNGKGEEKYVRTNDEDNIIISLYGNYNKYLESIGIGYVNREWYMKKMCFGYFQLRYKLEKDNNFKKEWLNKLDSLNLFQKAILKTCSLPDDVFIKILRFCILLY